MLSRMRRASILTLALSLALMAQLPQAVAWSRSHHVVTYTGTTSTGGTIRLVVATIDGQRGVQEFDIEGTVTCSVSGYSWVMGAGSSWGGGLDPSLVGHHVSYLDAFEPSFRTALDADWDASGASGTALIAWARLLPTDEQQAENCTTGTMDWTATPDAAAATPQPVSSDTHFVRFVDGVRQPDTSTQELRETSTTAGHTRFFYGPISQPHRRISFQIRSDDPYSVLHVGIDTDNACPSGATQRFAINGLFWRLKLDPDRTFSTSDGMGDFQAHWSGKIKPLTAAGDLSTSMAAYIGSSTTEVEACHSGPLTWYAAYATA